MGWNEPGGGRDQDPWKGGRQDNGPPDLDELFKSISRKLEEWFGKKPSSGGGGSGGPSNAGFIGGLISILVLAVLVWIGKGFFIVEEAKQALVLRFGKQHEILGAGLHLRPPLIYNVFQVDTLRVNEYQHNASILTKDLDIVLIDLVIQYQVSDPASFFLKIEDAFSALKQATESALRHVAGEMEMEAIINQDRAVVNSQVAIRLQEHLDTYESGLRVTQVKMKKAYPPDQVIPAFDDVAEAVQDRERSISKAKAYRDGVIPEAEGRAIRLEEEANAYKEQHIAQAKGEADRFEKLLSEYQKAPDVTRQRLYLESIEQVLQNSSKVLLDTDGGQNLTYLPLDKLMGQSNRPVSSALTDFDTKIRSNLNNDTLQSGRNLGLQREDRQSGRGFGEAR